MDYLCTFNSNINTRCPICNKLLLLHIKEENFIRLDNDGYADDLLQSVYEEILMCPSCKREFEFNSIGKKYFIKSDKNNIKIDYKNPFIKY